jgi:glycosyltransferase involved in cell wall biosynthesis
MKKILIVAPFKNFGGRENHINLIAKCLNPYYDVHILSTSSATKHSIAFQDINRENCHIINELIINKNIILRTLTSLSYLKSNRKNEFHSYLNNTFTKKFFNLKSIKVKFLKKIIHSSDLILMPVILNEPFVKTIIDFAYKANIPVVIRTITTIDDKMIKENTSLSRVSHFIHHSFFNANRLTSFLNHKFSIIDQSIVAETKMVSIPIMTKSNLIFGFLGRLEKNKNVLKLIEFFKKNGADFLIAGKGTELEKVHIETINSNNCKYIGIFNPSNLDKFYEKVDVIIIASNEEGGPFVGIEAMAAGKIIVSTRVGAMEERLMETKNNFWIEIDDIEKSLTSILKSINKLNENEINAIKASNREKYLKEYSFETIQRKYKNLIDSQFTI